MKISHQFRYYNIVFYWKKTKRKIFGSILETAGELERTRVLLIRWRNYATYAYFTF